VSGVPALLPGEPPAVEGIDELLPLVAELGLLLEDDELEDDALGLLLEDAEGVLGEEDGWVGLLALGQPASIRHNTAQPALRSRVGAFDVSACTVIGHNQVVGGDRRAGSEVESRSERGVAQAAHEPIGEPVRRTGIIQPLQVGDLAVGRDVKPQ
jgi:hypothetical protein|tara:strand:- start:164 stop:628 length:465 start_codon:yes stop_codon:yes gene_type:complete